MAGKRRLRAGGTLAWNTEISSCSEEASRVGLRTARELRQRQNQPDHGERGKRFILGVFFSFLSFFFLINIRVTEKSK